MPDSIVQIRGLTKRFGEFHALRGIDLEVRKGEVVAIIGPSGSGKTTLLRCVNLLEHPDGGRLEVDGLVLVEETPRGVRYASGGQIRRARTEIGMVFQHFHLFPHMTVLENIIDAPMSVRGLSRRQAEERAEQLLAQVGLAGFGDRYPLRLSGGQQQRVAIARALAMEPHLMLFDEVTSSVDPEMVGEILVVMQRLAADGMTMLVVTHEMGFAGDVADRILFMDHGVIVEQGPARSVLARPQHERTQRFLRAVRERVPMKPAGNWSSEPVALGEERMTG